MDKNTITKIKFMEFRKQKAIRADKDTLDLRKIDKIADILCPTIDEISEELSLIRRQ